MVPRAKKTKKVSKKELPKKANKLKCCIHCQDFKYCDDKNSCCEYCDYYQISVKKVVCTFDKKKLSEEAFELGESPNEEYGIDDYTEFEEYF